MEDLSFHTVLRHEHPTWIKSSIVCSMVFVIAFVAMAAIVSSFSSAIIAITSHCMTNASIESIISSDSSASSSSSSGSSILPVLSLSAAVHICLAQAFPVATFLIPWHTLWNYSFCIVSACQIEHSSPYVSVTILGFGIVERLANISSSCWFSLSSFCVHRFRGNEKWKITDCMLSAKCFWLFQTGVQRCLIFFTLLVDLQLGVSFSLLTSLPSRLSIHPCWSA